MLSADSLLRGLGRALLASIVPVSVLAMSSCSETARPDECERIIRRHTVVFPSPAVRTPSRCSVDGPLMGNGYCGVAMSGSPDSLTYHLSRNDFWRLRSALDETYPAATGKIRLCMPALAGASYRVEQSLYDATTTARFTGAGEGVPDVSAASYVAATEDILVVVLEAHGQGKLEGSAQLLLPEDADVHVDPPAERYFPDRRSSGTTSRGVRYIHRAFVDSVDIPSGSAAAMYSAAFPLQGDGACPFTLEEGRPVNIVCALGSGFKSEDCLGSVQESALSWSRGGNLAKLRSAHLGWWSEYWHRSYVDIPDSVVEKQYYLSLYGTASCSRDPDFPPGLFGNWITAEHPFWNGDYHLNYNHMAPFYALYGANRIEQAEPYYAPLLAFMERGMRYSEDVAGIPDGIMLPVGIGPLGTDSTCWSPYMEERHRGWIDSGNVEAGGLFWGQKSNAAYAVANLSMQFYRTWDEDFARKVYPFVKGVATFWEQYLVLEDGRYVIYDDAIHEGTVGNKNPIVSLGLVRMVMKTACDMGECLGLDVDRRPAWRDRAQRLSQYPLQERDGRTVFRYTEEGTGWWPDNTLGIQHIYPAGAIGPGSPEDLLQVSRNTIDAMDRWGDFNGTNSFFPAAVRVGYDPSAILRNLHAYCLHTFPNGFQLDNPHGIENLSTVPNTVDEMLCMGYGDVVRVFPAWPGGMDASFHDLRVEGAFLVSAKRRGGEVRDLRIRSEKGRVLTLLNPWRGSRVEVAGPRGMRTVVEGDTLGLPTVPGGEYRFRAVR